MMQSYKVLESYMKGNAEIFNSYIGINWLAHIEHTLIKIIYIKSC